jgi:hypothetical protein
MTRQPQQPGEHAEHGREHDAGERDAQRVGHAGGERAQVAVARGVVDQQLADVEAGRIGEEAEPRLDAARVEVRADVAGDDERKCDHREREPALDEPVAQPARAARRAPCRIADRRGERSRHCRALLRASGSAARTSGRPWSRGC